MAVARHRVGGGRGPGESAYADLPVLDMGDSRTRYFVSLDVADEPGVLAAVATVFADNAVSIETVRQQQVRASGDDSYDDGQRAELVIVTHAAPDSALVSTVETLLELPQVHEVSSVMRVEGD